MTEYPRGDITPMRWYNVLLEDDCKVMDVEWMKLLAGESTSFELRLKRPFIAEKELIPGIKVEGQTWILASAYPETAEDGTVIGVLGCITDISRQKWMESL